MALDLNAVAAYAFGLLLLYVIIRLLVVPIRILGTLLYNAGIGVVMLLVFNLVGGPLGVDVPVNPVSVGTTAVLGVPGLAALVILNRMWG